MIPNELLWRGIEEIYSLHGTRLNLAEKFDGFDQETLDILIEDKDTLFNSVIETTIDIDSRMNHISSDIDFTYRFKSEISMEKKFYNLNMNKQLYKVFNDVLGMRFIMRVEPDTLIKIAESFIDSCPSTEMYNCRIADQIQKGRNGYKGIHVYIRIRNNFAFPIEIQFWTRSHALLNDYLHDRIYKGDTDDTLNLYASDLRDWLEGVPKFPGEQEFKSYVDYLYEKVYHEDNEDEGRTIL